MASYFLDILKPLHHEDLFLQVNDPPIERKKAQEGVIIACT